MTRNAANDFVLRRCLLDPTLVTSLDAADMQQLISQARSARLLASLATRLEDENLTQQLPEEVRRHFDSARLIFEKQVRDIAYECKLIGQTLHTTGDRLLLLKGCAYITAGLPVGRGRLVTDLDILVPREKIGIIEQRLNDSGWESGYVNSYNETYYRRWSHEIPPMTHSKRGTTLDVHHNIMPPTSKYNVDAQLLLDAAIEVAPGVFALSRADMVIHSATHLFHEGEFYHGLRDLWDLDRMLRDFPAQDPGFWDKLRERATALELTAPLYHALNYVMQVFETPLPQAIVDSVATRGALLRKPLMDFLFKRAFRPDHTACRLPHTGLALYLLYVRSHYLRMPLYLLIPHLARKAWMGYFEEDLASPDEEIRNATRG